MITDLAPVERRGEAVSYWSIAVYGGLSFGPVLGAVLHGKRSLRRRVGRVGRRSRSSPRSSACSRSRSNAAAPVERPRHLFHRAAIGPGTVLVPRADRARRLHRVHPAVRRRSQRRARAWSSRCTACSSSSCASSARGVPDRLGGRTTATIALDVRRASASGSIAVWPTVPGLVVGTVVFAGGHVAHVSRAAAARARRRERCRARVGRRHVLVVLRRVAGPRRAHLRRGRRGHAATAARSPTGAVCARSPDSWCCAARSEAPCRAPRTAVT